MAANPYIKYQEQSVMTMTHGEMLVKLYDETVRQTHIAIAAITAKDVNAAHHALLKAQEIVDYLRSTLDFKYEISNQLAEFYLFFNEQFRKANYSKEIKGLAEVASLITELRDAFAQSERTVRVQQQTGMLHARIG